MTRTLQQIKDEYARGFAYRDWNELKANESVLTVNRANDEVAIRYANEQKRELVEMLEMVVMDLEERGRAYGDIYTMSKNLITKHKQS